VASSDRGECAAGDGGEMKSIVVGRPVVVIDWMWAGDDAL
jgi:hypothetical protein